MKPEDCEIEALGEIGHYSIRISPTTKENRAEVFLVDTNTGDRVRNSDDYIGRGYICTIDPGKEVMDHDSPCWKFWDQPFLFTVADAVDKLYSRAIELVEEEKTKEETVEENCRRIKRRWED